MKKLLFLLLLSFSAAAQVTNAPRTPFVNVERVRTDEVSFRVLFQQNAAPMNISGMTFKCDIMERGISYVRVALSEGSGITKTDSSITVALTSQQVQLLRKDAYQYRVYTVSGSTQTTRLAGNFSLWQIAPSSGSGYSSEVPAILINYTSAAAAPTAVNSFIGTSVSAGTGVSVTPSGNNYRVDVSYNALDSRYPTISTLGGQVRSTPLTGLSTSSATAVTSSDNPVTAAGKLQAQVNTKLNVSDTNSLLRKSTAAGLYVGKVSGKQLSTEDYTPTAKQVVDIVTAGGVFMEQFGGNANGSTSNATAMINLISYLTTNGGGTVRLLRGSYNLNGQVFTLPANVTLSFEGGKFINGAIIGTNSSIVGNLDQNFGDVVIRGSFKKSSTVYNYATMAEMKTKLHWPGKLCRTNGFHFENDGGGGDYYVDLNDVFAAENSFFTDYWVNTNTAGGAGLYVVLSTRLTAKYISKGDEVNLAVFGIKYDADFLNPVDKKYYTTSSYTTLATDNTAAMDAAIRQVRFWANNQMPKNFVLTETLLLNSTLYLEHGAHNFTLRGSGYADNVAISSNNAIKALIENYYSAADPNALTGTFYTMHNVTFKGHNRVENGLIVKNGYEADETKTMQFHDFTNAGIVCYGISSTFKLGIISCFRNKHGVLITSTHPYRVSSNTNTSDGLMTLYMVSGDANTDGLITIDCGLSDGASLKVFSLKSEINNNATILIKRSTAQQYLLVGNAFTNGSGDFIKIENYGGTLPTIELYGIFHNDPPGNKWDINDLLSNKKIRLFKNPTASFPHIIYTNNTRTYQNGYMVFRNGVPSNLSPASNFGTTANRPGTSLIEAGFIYFDTDLNTLIVWNGSAWITVSSKIIDTTSTPYTKSTLNAAYPSAKVGDMVIQDAAGFSYVKKDNSSTGNWSVFASSQLP